MSIGKLAAEARQQRTFDFIPPPETHRCVSLPNNPSFARENHPLKRLSEVPKVAHPVRYLAYVPPSGSIAWSLLGRQVIPSTRAMR